MGTDDTFGLLEAKLEGLEDELGSLEGKGQPRGSLTMKASYERIAESLGLLEGKN